MSKWALVADMTTGLANALESYNKGQMDEVDKHLGIIDRMITAQKMGYDLELAKLKYQNQGMDPLDVFKLKQEQELHSARMDAVARRMRELNEPFDTAFRNVIEPNVVEAGNKARESSILLSEKEKRPDIYEKQVGAQYQGALADIATGKEKVATSEANINVGLPQKGAEAKVAEAQGTIQTEPQMSLAKLQEQEAQANIADIREDTERRLRNAEIEEKEANARAIKDMFSYNAAKAFRDTANLSSDLEQDLMKLESSSDPKQQSILFANKYPQLKQYASSPTLMKGAMRRMAAQAANMTESYYQNFVEQFPDIITKPKKLGYGIGPYPNLEAMPPQQKAFVEKSIANLQKLYDVEIVGNTRTAGTVWVEKDTNDGRKKVNVSTPQQSESKPQTQTQQKPAKKQEVKPIEGKPAQQTKPTPKKDILPQKSKDVEFRNKMRNKFREKGYTP